MAKWKIRRTVAGWLWHNYGRRHWRYRSVTRISNFRRLDSRHVGEIVEGGACAGGVGFIALPALPPRRDAQVESQHSDVDARENKSSPELTVSVVTDSLLTP